MKIDRLLAITIYLLNHGKTSAQFLAQHFEVSTRTIMRDMDTLCLAGIPVVSTYGVEGGYEIMETFKMQQ
jgi:predicted DNA-binding transcriptional regulator YafY